MKLIDKDALVAEIDRLYDEKGAFYAADVLYNLKERLDTLDVKEVDLEKEPASEDLETAAMDYDNQGIALYAEDKDGDIVEISNVRYAAFKEGAQWQKEKDNKELQLAEEHGILTGMNMEREQMMKGAIDARIIAIGQNAIVKEENEDDFRKCASKFQDGDKVKVIIIKE